MSLLAASIRSAPNLVALTPVRSLSTAPAISAAAATSPSRYVRRAVPSRASSSVKPASAPAPATTSAAPVLDDFPDDFPSPAAPEIDDYALLSPPPRYPASTPSTSKSVFPSPTPSPPLTSLPGQGYTPLPSAPSAYEQSVTSSDESGIPGEAPVAAGTDWSTSFSGLSDRPFEKEVAQALLKPLSPEDVEIKPDGLLYLPEIKYRRTLTAAFGPGGWGLAPRGETSVGQKIVSREWGLVCLGRLVAIARGEQEFFDPSGVATATEACKSNALMRCCKDLGIASELWDPRFIRDFKAKHCVEVFVEHAVTKKKRKLWKKKGDKFEYPYKEGV